LGVLLDDHRFLSTHAQNSAKSSAPALSAMDRSVPMFTEAWCVTETIRGSVS
jgi:hypothetical protein